MLLYSIVCRAYAKGLRLFDDVYLSVCRSVTLVNLDYIAQ